MRREELGLLREGASRRSCTLIAVVCGGMHIAMAGAQETVIDEIVVTAQKREQSILEVPLSVQALQGEELERQGLSDVKSALTLVPGASQPAEISPGSEVYQLRGVYVGDILGDATVASYLDEFAFSIPGVPYAPPANLYDVERVEVLQGPQGTLYGSNSLGGVVKVVTADPDLDNFGLRARGSFAAVEDADSDYSGNIMVNVPIVEGKLGLRGVIGAQHLSGFSDAPALGLENINKNDTLMGRLKLRYAPSERTNLTLGYWRYDSDQDYTNRMDNVDPEIDNATGPGASPTDYTLYTARLEHDLGFATLLASGGYKTRYNGLSAVGSQATFDYFVVQDFNFRSFNQELRLSSNGDGPVHWLIGGFYQDTTEVEFQDFRISNPELTTLDDARYTSESWAVFGEASIDLFEGRLRPLLGLRYFKDDRSLTQQSTTFIDNVLVDQSTDGADGRFEDFSARVNLSYFPTDAGMLYVNVAKGFRPGALQTTAKVIQLETVLGITTHEQLDEDTLISYEAGAKWRFFGGDVTTALAFYMTDWEEAQLQTGAAGVSGIVNVGDVTGRGVDISVQWRTPIDGLVTELAGNFNDTELDNIEPGISAAVPHLQNGIQQPGVPERSFTFASSYSRPLGYQGLTLLADLRFNHRSRAQDLAAGRFSGELNILSAQIGFERDGYLIQLFGDNITNERGPAAIAQDRYILPRPRTIGVRFSLDFMQ